MFMKTNIVSDRVLSTPEASVIHHKGGNNPPQVLPAGKFGFLGNADTIRPNHVIELQLVIPQHPTDGLVTKVITINGDRDITEVGGEGTNGSRTFTQKVLVRGGRDGVYTLAEDNSLMTVSVTEYGFLKVTVYTVIAQEGNFFLAQQCTHQVQGYRMVDGGIKFPAVVERAGRHMAWHQLNSFGKDMLEGKANKLPSISTYVEPIDTSISGLSDNEVRVTGYSIRRNNGVGVNKKGLSVSLHWSKISQQAEIDPCPRFLMIGEKVLVTKMGPPRRGSTTNHEALDILLIEREADNLMGTELEVQLVLG